MSARFARTDAPHGERTDIKNLLRIWPYISAFKGRAAIALACLVVSKMGIVGVPLVLREIIDALGGDISDGYVLALGLLAAYGALRFASALFNELRDVLFARVRYSAMHTLSVKVLEHLHNLSLRFHLERKTGNIIRDLERGTQSASSILNYLTFNIVPTLAEFGMVASVLIVEYPVEYFVVVLIAVIAYIAFTLSVTNWRMHYRHRMNRLDSSANGRAVDSLLNFETVKYFGNEQSERDTYDEHLSAWVDAGVKAQSSMSLLNFGQASIVTVAVLALMYLAVSDVESGELTIGDLVMVNAMMLQLFMPLGILGIVYRQLHYALADMDLVLKLLDQKPEVVDRVDAQNLRIDKGTVSFRSVNFAYNVERPILHDISFDIPAGSKCAVVGSSGAGKSTLLRLLFRFYEVDSGVIEIDGQNIRDCYQQSLREAIGVVPQDTVLFNDTIAYNLRYANMEAGSEEMIRATKIAGIFDFINSLPEEFETRVGERGLKLSGGEKQRMAIARVVLKNPAIMVFDEATSSLDSQSEKAILDALAKASENVTTLVIAHRLSTVVDADRILVIDAGRIVEQGRHQQLLDQNGLYTTMWRLQQRNDDVLLEP